MSRTIKDVIADWLLGGRNDYGELESRINYFIATEIEPKLRNLAEAERQVVEAAVAWNKANYASSSDFDRSFEALEDAVERLEKVRGV
jgi:hypothetical protein